MKNFFSPGIPVLLFLILYGCSKDSPPPFIPSAEPTNRQIINSTFYKFTEKLRSYSTDERNEAAQNFLREHPGSPVIEGDSLICFYFYGKADTVLLNGDLQAGWAKPDTMKFINCGNETFFFKICAAPPDARLDYLFIVDGKEITDPLNKRTTPSGYGPHSEVIMPQFVPDTTRYFRADVPHGSIDSIMFISREKEISPRPVKIYKPSGYDTLTALPSLYVMDGFKAMVFMSFTNVLDNLIADKKIIPAIVVFLKYINEDDAFFFEENEQLTNILCNELVPFIDKTYKTNKDPHFRAITGISAGGHYSLITAFKRPDIFLNAAGQSANITEELLDAMKSAPDNKKYLKQYHIYFDAGFYDLPEASIDDHTFLTANRKLYKEIKNTGFNFMYREFNDGHQWANWRERTDDILIYFFAIH